MADPTVQITFGDEEFLLAHVSVQEMVKVKSWTAHRNRREWFAAITDEDPEALLAAYVLVKQRKGENVRFTDADFDLDSLAARFVDPSGREIEPLLEKNADGSVKTDHNGIPTAALKDGQAVWVYTDNREEVPPTEAA